MAPTYGPVRPPGASTPPRRAPDSANACRPSRPVWVAPGCPGPGNGWGGLLHRLALVFGPQLFAVGFVVFALVFGANAILARRLAAGLEQSGGVDEEGLWAYVARVGARVGDQLAYRRLIDAGLLLLGLILALIMGLVLSAQWPLVLRFFNAVPFGVA